MSCNNTKNEKRYGHSSLFARLLLLAVAACQLFLKPFVVAIVLQKVHLNGTAAATAAAATEIWFDRQRTDKFLVLFDQSSVK